MAGMLWQMVENMDLTAAAISACKAGAGAAGGYILKKVWGKIVSEKKQQCMTKECTKTATKYGLCQECHAEAQQVVERGGTWQQLADLGLCKLPTKESPFNDAYTRAMEDN